MKKVESRDFYNEEFLKTNIKNSLEELRKRECNCDFNISDLIEASYDKEYLFFTVNHPSFKIIRYMSVQILKILGIDTYDIEDLVIEKLDHIMIPIYPSVASGLELKFIDDGQLYNYIDGKNIVWTLYERLYRVLLRFVGIIVKFILHNCNF